MGKVEKEIQKLKRGERNEGEEGGQPLGKEEEEIKKLRGSGNK